MYMYNFKAVSSEKQITKYDDQVDILTEANINSIAMYLCNFKAMSSEKYNYYG